MKIYKPKFWTKNYHTFLSIILLPISFFYQILIYLKKLKTRERKFSIPIICIGNIYIGGTGKTPLAIKLFKLFKENKKVVVIKKDYKNQKDEIDLLKKHSKVISCKKREYGIIESVKKGFDLVILDDGYQDFSIKKNINIVCFNNEQKIGNGQTIPSGPLRQRLSSLNNCDIVMINGKKNYEFEEKLKIHNKKLNFFYFNYYLEKLDQLKNRKLIAFAGIGNPENFFSLLKSNRLNIIKELSFPDHYNYTQNDLNSLVELEKKYNAKLVTTEKDFLRISKYNRGNIAYVPITLKIDKENEFTVLVNKILK